MVEDSVDSIVISASSFVRAMYEFILRTFLLHFLVLTLADYFASWDFNFVGSTFLF